MKHYDGYTLGVQKAGQDDLGSVPCVEDYDGRDEGQWEDLGRKFGRRGSLSLPISFPAFQQCATSTRSFAQ